MTTDTRYGGRILVLGSINQDHIVNVSRRPAPGETVTNATLSTHSGGKGANQAAAAARLGASVSMLGRVGDDVAGEKQLDALSECGVSTELVKKLPDTRTGTAFVTVTQDGENSIIVAPGANVELQPQDLEQLSSRIASVDVLVAQMEVPVETVEFAVHLLSNNSNARAILNLAPPAKLASQTLVKLDPLVLNQSEAAYLVGEQVCNLDGAADCAKRLLSLGSRSVVLTLGAQGAILATSSSLEHIPAPTVRAIDTTGAGDAFVGALSAKLAWGSSLEEAVDYAVQMGSKVVTMSGARSSL